MHVGKRTIGSLLETNRATGYSPRRIQQLIKETAEQAEITKRVYPHLLPALGSDDALRGRNAH
jgi:integrase/recombinase XerD